LNARVNIQAGSAEFSCRRNRADVDAHRANTLSGASCEEMLLRSSEQVERRISWEHYVGTAKKSHMYISNPKEA
jgi:hypothetical protein